ncbi:MAG: AbgT family transporter [Halothermotrichaceae bacterium]
MDKNNSKIKKAILHIEKLGNKVPHPFWIFVFLSLMMLLFSHILAGTEFLYPQQDKMVNMAVNDLLKVDYLLDISKNLPTIFASFKPLSIVILIYMGISVLQESGAFSAFIRMIFSKVSTKYIIFAIAIIGVNSNIASDAGVIILPTMGAALFQSLGFNPWLGITVGYASANGGFTLNMLLAGTDAILSDITSSVIKNTGLSGEVTPLSNWYFMFTASILFVILTFLVTKYITQKIIARQTGELTSIYQFEKLKNLSFREKKGLMGIFYVTFIFILIVFILYRYYFLITDIKLLKFISDHIIGLLFIYFTISGLAFGLNSGTVNSIWELPRLLGAGIDGTKSFIITVFPAAIFVEFLYDSNLGFWLANIINQLLQKSSLPSLLMLILFILIVAFVNLFITSSSVKWIFIAPLVIPIFANLGFSPGLTQLSYRLGDTCTNIIAPTEYYLPVIISLFESYKPDSDIEVGIGTVISLSLPYTITYLVALILLLIIWMLLGLPIGI